MKLSGRFVCALLFWLPVWAAPQAAGAEPVHRDSQAAPHGEHLYYMFEGEAGWADTDEGNLVIWDMHGWYGGDVHKFVLRSEGEHHGQSWEQAELWGLYSRNISEFWDAQAGIREDFIPFARTYFAFGVSGMLPYFIETGAHLFVSDLGDVSARIESATDLNITQRLIFTPHTELNFSAQPVAERQQKAGLTGVELGAKLRYEITRKFAPYIDLNYARLAGATAALAGRQGKNTDSLTLRAGLRIWFN